jgi:uncharacterized protein (TIGR00255 family)
MTGFGRAEAALWGGQAIAEVKCVNSRHLDLRVRLPRELAALEAAVRSVVSARFARGQVEVNVRISGAAALDPSVHVSEAAARAYFAAAERLRRGLGLGGPLGLADLLSLPGVAQLREAELDPAAAADPLAAAVGAACERALEMRSREGQALARDLEERLARIEKALARIEERADEVRRGLAERLTRRLAALAPDVSVDPGRLEQELVLYADRLDVTEEIVRVRSHAAQFRAALAAEEAVGRRLEFLLQELVRETNTIGSKCQDAPLAAEVVELKTELERMREQASNVE